MLLTYSSSRCRSDKALFITHAHALEQRSQASAFDAPLTLINAKRAVSRTSMVHVASTWTSVSRRVCVCECCSGRDLHIHWLVWDPILQRAPHGTRAGDKRFSDSCCTSRCVIKGPVSAYNEAVRIRPDAVDDPSQTVSRLARPAVTATSASSLVVEPTIPFAGTRDSRYTFHFDRVYGPEADQLRVFHASVTPLVRRFLDGYNTTIFAYGQTSSGKSYSMGTSDATEHICMDEEFVHFNDHVGILPRAARQIFQALHENSGLDQDECAVSVSFLELYNEDLIDLLSDRDNERNTVQIRETRTGDIVCMGLQQRTVTSAYEVVSLLQQGMKMRKTHETDMNAQSSRSHAIFSVTLTRKRRGTANSAMERTPSTLGRQSPDKTFTTPRTPRSGLPTLGGRAPISRAGTPTRPSTPTRPTASRGVGACGTPQRRATDDATCVTTTSKLHFVDLAGSERLKRTAATGDRAREGIAINSGLHALGNVISVLSDPVRTKRPSHVPYRDSKLTRLLQDSLGGNSHTLMIACISSAEGNAGETLNTLQYAQRARNIRNKVERNQVEQGWDNIEYLQSQVLSLRHELELVHSSKELVISSPKRPARLMPSEHESELLAWQEKCSALSRKNVQLSAQLVQREQERRGTSVDFLQAAEPVIVEYEKAVDALEGQINMLKAAVSHLEQVIQDQSTENLSLSDRATSAERQLDVLRGSVRDMHERLDERNARVEALELQLRRATASTTSTTPLSVRTSRSSSASSDAPFTTPQRPFGGILDYKGRSPGKRTYRVATQGRAKSELDTYANRQTRGGDGVESTHRMSPSEQPLSKRHVSDTTTALDRERAAYPVEFRPE